MTTIELPVGFELSASREFYRGFTPGAGMASAAEAHDTLTFSYLVERSWQAAAVAVTQRGRRLELSCAGPGNAAAAVKQVVRMLGLDADAGEWLALGRRNLMVGQLQRQFPGFFTATFPSPYEAGVGGIIAQRLPMKQAAAIRRRLCEATGESVALDGPAIRTLPSPRRLLELTTLPGLPPQKLEWLHGLARAALDGWLTAEHLRSLGDEGALEKLKALPGIGPWTAEHMYARGAAPFDALPTAEPRVLRGAALAYAVPSLTAAKYRELSDGWRPFRMWVAILLARGLQRAGQWAPTRHDARGKAWPLRA